MTDCNEYLRNELVRNENIYIDTSSLMNDEALDLFVTHCATIPEEERAKIIVLADVIFELRKHLNSPIILKSKQASHALEVINSRPEIFYLEDEVADSDKYADRTLLSVLTLYKRSNQLLITNDRELSQDAFNLNGQKSNPGKLISVCYLTKYGYIQKCDCVRESLHSSNDQTKEAANVAHPQFEAQSNTETVSTEEETPNSYCEESPVENDSEKNQASPHSEIWGVVIGCGVGFVLGKYGNKLLKILAA